jgi:hypothetical protein
MALRLPPADPGPATGNPLDMIGQFGEDRFTELEFIEYRFIEP